MIEYTIQNKTQTIMNYTYKITTSNTYPSHHIEVTLDNTIYTIESDYSINTNYKKYLHKHQRQYNKSILR